MNTIKLTTTIAFALLVATSFAANGKMVKSKKGNVELMEFKNGGSVICTADFNDELKLLKEDGAEALVKGACGTGWVTKSKIEYVAKGPGDKSLTVQPVEIGGWVDNPTLIDFTLDDISDVAVVDINRDFKEYLVHTLDREQLEMSNGEN